DRAVPTAARIAVADPRRDRCVRAAGRDDAVRDARVLAVDEGVKSADGDLRSSAVEHLQLRSDPEWTFALVETEDERRAAADREAIRHADLYERHQELVDAEVSPPFRKRPGSRAEEQWRRIRIARPELVV